MRRLLPKYDAHSKHKILLVACLSLLFAFPVVVVLLLFFVLFVWLVGRLLACLLACLGCFFRGGRGVFVSLF